MLPENPWKTNQTTISTYEDLYDLSMLQELDDEEYLVEMLTIFLKETPVDLKEIREAINTGETETVCKQAHKLKNSAGVIQADRLMTLLADIETNAKSGKVNPELITLVNEAHIEHKKIELGLKNHLKTLAH